MTLIITNVLNFESLQYMLEYFQSIFMGQSARLDQIFGLIL
ncbi:MAG: hypothetical protein K0S34_1596 [Bacillales bacterium]|jgi:hypothetical protein|nr:hypothetical protein [Bacillales bacterium]